MKKAMKKEDNLRKGLKRSSGFMFGLFVNILIVFLIVKLFRSTLRMVCSARWQTIRAVRNISW